MTETETIRLIVSVVTSGALFGLFTGLLSAFFGQGDKM